MLEQVPTRGYLGLATAGLACSLVATVAVVAAPVQGVPEDYELDPELALGLVDQAMTPVVANDSAADELSDPSVQLALHVDGADYVVLADVDDGAMPKHGKLRRTREDYVDSVIANVPASEVPAWANRKVRVDDACVVTLTKFAVVSRLSGDPGYAGIESEAWTIGEIFEHGHRTLVGKLDACGDHHPVLARDIAAPQLTVFATVAGAPQLEAARERVRTSQAAAEIAAEWRAQRVSGAWTDNTELVATAARDPRTNTTWIAVLGTGGIGCGEPSTNIFGLFRVEADGSLATVQIRRQDALTAIAQLVDTDGDGTPELVGSGWLGTVLVTDLDGNELSRLDVPFFGCPC